MNTMQKQIRKRIKDRVILDLQKIVGIFSSREKKFETGTSTCHFGPGNRPNVSNKNLSKKDVRSAFNVREAVDLSSCF